MPFSLRLDADTEALLDRLSRGKGLSRATVVRKAVAHYAATAWDNLSAYEKLKPLTGIVRSGRHDLSQDTGRKLTALLKKKQAERARRSR